ncbi:MAG: TIGR04013 family B12-binding domain/radical SAM domain-containing protein [Polyangiaceae bacterium]
MSPSRLRILGRDTKTAKNALSVLTGTLRAHPETRDLDIRFPARGEPLRDALDQAASDGVHALVLWSFYSTELDGVWPELHELRSGSRRDVTHLAGGPHASAEPEATLREGFDYVAIGEGERTVTGFVGALLRGADPSATAGIGRLDGGDYRSTGPGEKVDLDDYPAFNLPDRRFNAIEITRGCVYACSFCQTPYMFKAKFRHRSIPNVREHLRIHRRENLKYLRFVTPTSLSYGADGEAPNLDAVEELLAACRAELGPDGKIFFGTFPSEVRPEHVTDQAMRVLRKYVDNDNLVIGGQSGSNRVLESTLRGHTVEDVTRACEIAIAHGFKPNIDLLFGLPGEEEADVEATRRLLGELEKKGARVHTHTFMPLPGTPLKRAPAGSVSEKLERDVNRLEAHGRSYGNWRDQLALARSLEARQPPRRRLPVR